MFRDPLRIKDEHGRIKETNRQKALKDLESANIRLAFHIHKQPASIDVKKQINDFGKHRKLLKLHAKYKDNKIWGGAFGSVGFKASPRRERVSESIILPPLSNKPIFPTD